jgi:hypothetical protein
MSGILRITITPKPPWIVLLIEICVAAIFAVLLRPTAHIAAWYRIVLIWVSMSAVFATLYQFYGEEIIEFDTQNLAIRREIFGWVFRSSEYPISNCREFEWREEKAKSGNDMLQCKVGCRTIRFGKYISEGEAVEIVSALQSNLPSVAQQVSAVIDKQLFTTLKLN